MKARVERKICAGSSNARIHQLRHVAAHDDGSLTLNGVSIIAGPHAGQQNSATGDCHAGTLDRHNGIYIMRTPRKAQPLLDKALDKDGGSGEQGSVTSDRASPQEGSRHPSAWMENSLIRIPRGGGLGPRVMSGRAPDSGARGGSLRNTASPVARSQTSLDGGTEEDAKTARPTPGRAGLSTGMLSKAGSHSALKSFNDSLKRGHVDTGNFLERAFVPSHPNSQYAARIPAEYENFQGSMDKWAAGPGGGVEQLQGHFAGSWRDVHAPDTRPFPMPPKTKMEQNVKLLPQSITTCDVSSQMLGCGARRRRPLTARDRLPLSNSSTPRRHAMRPQTARERPSCMYEGQEGTASLEQPQGGARSDENSLSASLSAGSTAYSRKALEIMRDANHRNRRESRIMDKCHEDLDIRGEQAVIVDRRASSEHRAGLTGKDCTGDGKENEQLRPAFQDEKHSGDGGRGGDGRSGWTPVHQRHENGSNDTKVERKLRPSTAKGKIQLDLAPVLAAREDQNIISACRKAQAKHDFLNKISDDIALFSGHSNRPTTAPTRSQRIKNELHAKMEARHANIRKDFRLFDDDHDGVINAADMAIGLNVINVPATAREIQELLSVHRNSSRSGEAGMTFDEYARDAKRIRFPSQNPFEGKDVKIPFWKPNARYARKWDGDYGKGPEGGGERIRTKLKWRNNFPRMHERPVPKRPSPRGFVREENWPMMSKFIPPDSSKPIQKPRLLPGQREKYLSAWSARFAKKAKQAIHTHDLMLWKKRVYEEAEESKYLLEKPLFAEQQKQ